MVGAASSEAIVIRTRYDRKLVIRASEARGAKTMPLAEKGIRLRTRTGLTAAYGLRAVGSFGGCASVAGAWIKKGRPPGRLRPLWLELVEHRKQILHRQTLETGKTCSLGQLACLLLPHAGADARTATAERHAH